MAHALPFHSVHEANKAVHERVYHTNTECAAARRIRLLDRRSGTAGYELCRTCVHLNRLGR